MFAYIEEEEDNEDNEEEVILCVKYCNCYLVNLLFLTC